MDGSSIGIPIVVILALEMAFREEPPMDETTTIGADNSKFVFRIHGINADNEAALRKQLRPRRVFPFFRKWPLCLVGIIMPRIDTPPSARARRSSKSSLGPKERQSSG